MPIPGDIKEREYHRFVETRYGPAVRVAPLSSANIEFLLSKFFSDVDFDELRYEEAETAEYYFLYLAGNLVDQLSVVQTANGIRYFRGLLVEGGLLTEDGYQLMTEGNEALVLEA